MIRSREICCDTSPSSPDTLKVSKQNRQSESPTRLRHVPYMPERQCAAQLLQDACPGKPLPHTWKESLDSDCSNSMWCQSRNCISLPFAETIAPLHVQS